MRVFKTLKHLWKHNRNAISGALVGRMIRMGILNWLPDSAFLRLRYRSIFHKKINLKNPRTFNEKLQWLKLNDRKPEYVVMVDKLHARQWVADRIGSEYVIPLLGDWDRGENIDFESLPAQFVLKCNHDSGCVFVCKDKENFDREKAVKRLNARLKENFYYWGREWPYKKVKPRIVAEQYLQDENGELQDYKVHCFNGEPRFILVCRDRFKKSGITEDFYTPQWEHMPMKRPGIPFAEKEIPKPEKLEEVLELSRKVARNLPFARIDFYIVQGKIYFGEITLFPAAGFKPFEPESWDVTLGDWLQLPKND